MINPLTMKLEQFRNFDRRERARLDAFVSGHRRRWDAKQDIISEGDHVGEIHLVLSGLAARYKILPDGDRQIMAFLIPGDLCDVEVFVLEEMDHGICAITETVCALIPAQTVKEMLSEISGLAQALWWSTMTDSAVLRERIIDHGRRDSRERIAHLFYEMLIRYRVVGLTHDGTFPFPVTQEELADATGMSPVHVNRTLKQLREDGLVDVSGRQIKVLDPAGLKAAARFNPNYLHLKRTEARQDPIAARVGDLI